MKTLYYLIVSAFCLFSFMNLSSQDKQFYPERLACDYAGVATNGKSVICYGEYGIVNYTFDTGSTWQRTNIGDKYNILKVIAKDDSYYGVTNSSIIKSANNGLTWANNEISAVEDVITFDTLGDRIYILTKKSVVAYDFSLNFRENIIPSLDTSNTYKELTVFGDYLFFTMNDCYLIRYDLSTNKTDTLNINNFIKSEDPDIDKKLKLKNLIFYNNKFYLLCFIQEINLIMPLGSYYFLKSADNGDNWSFASDSIYSVSILNFINGSPYFIGHKDYFPQFNKINENGTAITLNEPDTNKNQRYLPDAFQSDFIKGFIVIDKDTVIAAGDYNTITISYDGGKSWNLKSMLKSNLDDLPQNRYKSEIINSNLIYSGSYSLNQQVFSRSTDGGITWLPRKSASLNSNWASTHGYAFFDDGSGFYFGYDFDTLDFRTIIYTTSDFGDNYNCDTLNYRFSDLTKKQGLNLGNESLFYRLDSIFIFSGSEFAYKTKLMDSVTIKEICNTGNDILYSLALKQTNPITTDSGSYYLDRKYFLFSSTDKGRSWNVVDSNLPFYVPYWKYQNKIYYTSSIYDLFFYDNYLIMPYGFDTTNFLYVYDLNVNQVDSTSLPMKLNFEGDRFFEFKNELYSISQYGETLYKIHGLGSNSISWDSITFKEIIPGWESWDPNKKAKGKYKIFSAWTDSENIYLTVGRTYRDNSPMSTGWSFKINYIKLHENDFVDVKTEWQTEKNDVYLYCTPPTPNPAQNYTKSTIYWNDNYDFNNALINIYDIFGNKLSAPNISIIKTSSYTADILWNCTGYPNGIYFIYATLTGDKTTRSVIVAR